MWSTVCQLTTSEIDLQVTRQQPAQLQIVFGEGWGKGGRFAKVVVGHTRGAATAPVATLRTVQGALPHGLSCLLNLL